MLIFSRLADGKYFPGFQEFAIKKDSAVASSGAATLNAGAGKVTTESLTTAAGGTYTLTISNSYVRAEDSVLASVAFGSASAGRPCVTLVTPAAGSVTIVIQNVHASAAFNGSLVVSFLVVKH